MRSSVGFSAVGSARREVKSRSPSGVNVADDSPVDDRVRRRGARSPAGSSSHSEVPYFFPSAESSETVVTRRVPSGDSASPAQRRVATKASRSSNVLTPPSDHGTPTSGTAERARR